MSTKHVVFSFILVARVIIYGYAYDGESEKTVINIEKNISDKLIAAKSTNNFKLLEEVDSLLLKYINGIDQLNEADARLANEKVSVMQLEILLIANNLRDWNYDITQPPKFSSKVMPPMPANPINQVLMAGMPAEQINDIETRKKYEKAIEENNKLKDKYLREKILQDIFDNYIFKVQIWLEAAKNNSSAKFDTCLDLLDKSIQDHKLKNKIIGQRTK